MAISKITNDGIGDINELTVDTNTLVVDSTNNRVGIGTTSPSQVLEITNGTSPAYVVQTRGDLQTILGPTGSLVTSAGQVGTITNSPFRFTTNNTERMRIDNSGRVGIGTSSPTSTLHVKAHINSINGGLALESNDGSQKATIDMNDSGVLRFYQNGNARMRLNSDGDFMFAKTTSSYTNTGIEFDYATGRSFFTVAGQYTSIFNRKTNDGIILYFAQDSTLEGSISVSGTTVSYNGGHLARWSQLTDGAKDETIVKGTVMTNLDQMAVWSHDAVEAQDAVYDEDGNVVTEAVEAKDAYTEDNEQLNCMAVSSVEGDPNVAGVFVNWDDDDDEFNDMNIAMTGDMVIRIAQGTTVARGDLLMSAGDGTAKPQGDDIVRSKTIAKVTSINVSHTYDDGSYLVPCVLMAC